MHTFQSALLGAVQREVLKASGSHAEIFSACESPIHTDHLARPFFPVQMSKKKKTVWAARLLILICVRDHCLFVRNSYIYDEQIWS